MGSYATQFLASSLSKCEAYSHSKRLNSSCGHDSSLSHIEPKRLKKADICMCPRRRYRWTEVSGNAASPMPRAEVDHLAIASPRTWPWGRDTLCEKPRKSSGLGSDKSGDQFPEGASLSFHTNEGRRCETSVLNFGPSPWHVLSASSRRCKRRVWHILHSDFRVQMSQPHQHRAPDRYEFSRIDRLMFMPLELEKRTHIDTASAAFHLNRKP